MDEATQVSTAGPKFVLQWPGDKEHGVPVPLDLMLEANREHEEVTQWLQRAPVGGAIITGGGASPRVSIRRVL